MWTKLGASIKATGGVEGKLRQAQEKTSLSNEVIDSTISQLEDAIASLIVHKGGLSSKGEVKSTHQNESMLTSKEARARLAEIMRHTFHGIPPKQVSADYARMFGHEIISKERVEALMEGSALLNRLEYACLNIDAVPLCCPRSGRVSDVELLQLTEQFWTDSEPGVLNSLELALDDSRTDRPQDN